MKKMYPEEECEYWNLHCIQSFLFNEKLYKQLPKLPNVTLCAFQVEGV